MQKLRLLLSTAILSLGFALPSAAFADQPATSGKTPLDDYIAKPDSTYSWKVVSSTRADGYTTFVVDLKSQSWRSVPEVDRTVWQHWLVIVKPDVVKHSTAYLRIGSGRNGSDAPRQATAPVVLMAKSTNTVVADLHMVPNQ